jgi:hypothetical protein
VADELGSRRLLVDEDPLALYRRSLTDGWGDGLPLVAPTESRVRELLESTPPGVRRGRLLRRPVTIEDPALGPLAMVAPAVRLSATPSSIHSTGPELGEHNEEIFGELLGISRTDLDQLHAEGVI